MGGSQTERVNQYIEVLNGEQPAYPQPVPISHPE